MSDPISAIAAVSAAAQDSSADPSTIALNPIAPGSNPIALANTANNNQEVISVGGTATTQGAAPAGQQPVKPSQPKLDHPHPHIATGQGNGVLPRRPRQRLVVCADGTWQSRDTVQSILQGNVFTSKEEKWLTNIAVLASAIAPDAGIPDEDGIIIRQNVFYLSGVGTTVSTWQNLYEGATGASLADKLEDAYAWICDNYQEGDELFFFGFSRGAYTARCLAAFLNWAGILRKHELVWFRTIWDAYQKRTPDNPHSLEDAAETLRRYTGRYPSRDAQETVNEGVKEGGVVKKEATVEITPDSAVERVKAKVSWAKAPPIQVLGVFDTVGSLGIPGNYMTPAVQKLFSFLDPGLGSNVKHAYHALALNEERRDYLPTLFFQDPKEIRDEWPRQVLRQCWFPGEHSDVGGGWIDHGASDIALAWMVGQVMDTYENPLLNIDIDVLRTLQDRRCEWAKQKDHESRSTLELQGIRQVDHKFADSNDRTAWANDCRVGYRHERLHHSVVASGKYDPETSPMFEEIRKNDRVRLDRLWAKASDPNSLTKTERALKWEVAEKDQVQPLQGAGAVSARGHGGNGTSMFPITLPIEKQKEQAEHHSETPQHPRSLSEKIKLGMEVVETSLADTFKSAALIPDAVFGKKHHEGEAEDKDKDESK
ncbi:unnamed protein product [Tilletia laevis]|uniref:T6SS Phospholipase effector Tle1-like catalytic domain-containing protein n=2 Tax=Tilletia TaxID=13289 RepID=A0A177UR60_9BASI|nr:hypothetical protein CF336_g1419 [Tilletia laevis]KAE8264092.1 hypothetical protein A4X03_0g1196 [Tilletia caries]CAD6942479.1 unnamed protein product [Tilletia controversa]CAD6893253.1 unnamed protein product [Tilletia caries]CAD6921439.1 unnamed protein product [Tilletia caries]